MRNGEIIEDSGMGSHYEQKRKTENAMMVKQLLSASVYETVFRGRRAVMRNLVLIVGVPTGRTRCFHLHSRKIFPSEVIEMRAQRRK
jgi:hypothetical protein